MRRPAPAPSAVALLALLLGAAVGGLAAPRGDAAVAASAPEPGDGDGASATGTFTRTLSGIRWHALRVDIVGCAFDLTGTLRYTVTGWAAATTAPQQAFLAFRASDDAVLFGLHQHVVDGQPYTTTVVGANRNDGSDFGLNRFAPATFIQVSLAGGCNTSQYLVYWASGPTFAQVTMSWTMGTVTVTDTNGTTGTFAYSKPDLGGVQARDGPPCAPSCSTPFVGAGAAMAKTVPVATRLVGAFLPDPNAPRESCAPASGGEWSCNNWSPARPVVHHSTWTSPTGRSRTLLPEVDERIFVVGTPAETGTWTFRTTLDVDANPVAAALSGVDVTLP